MAKSKRRQTKKIAVAAPVAKCPPSRQFWPLGVFVLALVVRLFHIRAVQNAPFGFLKLGDARSYDEWAHTIAAGDWIGSEIFYQAPLYPYFLGSIYSMFGDDLVAVRLVQAIIGALSAALLARAAATLFTQKEGIVAGVILALYSPAIFFDGLIQKSVLDLFLVCSLIWLLAPCLAANSARKAGPRLFVIGVVVGLLALSRENALVLIVPLAIWTLVSTTARPRAGTLALALALGASMILVPVGLRNYTVGSEFLLTTSQLGPNLYIGNHQGADGAYRSLVPRRGDARYERDDATLIAEQALERELSPREVSDYYVDEVVRFVSQQPMAWLRLMARKLILTWNALELVDTEDPYATSTYSNVLRWTGAVFHFGLLFPLAAVGVALSWGERKRLWPLYAIAAVYVLSVVTFYLFARYRYPLVPVLTIFAAVAVARARVHWGALSTRRRIGFATTFATCLVIAYLPLVDPVEMQALSHYNWAGGLRDTGDVVGAIDQYRIALKLDPEFALAHNNLANLYLARGRADEALVHLEKAVSSDASFEDAHSNLANLLVDRSEPSRAEHHARAALRLRADYPEASNALGNALAALGRRPEAREAYRRAIEQRPDYAIAHLNLATLLFEERELAGAKRHFTQASELDPTNAQAWNNLGIVHALEGDSELAAEYFQRAIAADPTYEEARRNLARARAGQP